MGVFGALATFIQKLFGNSQLFLADLVTRKFALNSIAVSAIAGIIVAAYVACTALLNTLSAAIPSELALAATWIIPSNFSACVVALLSAYGIKYAMDYKVMMVNQYLGVGK